MDLIKRIALTILLVLGNMLVATAILTPMAVDIEINSNDDYKSLSGDKYIVVNGNKEPIESWTEFTNIVSDNTTSDEEDTAIQVYIESNTLTNWSGLWRTPKANMLFLGIKDSIWELNMEERAGVFDAIKTYINPKEKATRTIQFIAYEEGSTRTLQVMEIKSTADNSVDKDLERLQDSTAYENKETLYYIVYGFGMTVAFIVVLFLFTGLGFLAQEISYNFIWWGYEPKNKNKDTNLN